MKNKIKYPYEFNRKKRKTAKIYARGKLIQRISTGIIIPLIFFSVLSFLGINIYIAGLSTGLWFLDVILFVFILIALMTIVEIPFNFYSSYIYEHKYGLSNYTVRSWFKDVFKSLFVSYIVFIPSTLGIYLFLRNFELWWIYASMFYLFISVFFLYLSPVIFLPFFYKMEPYRDVKQKRRLLRMVHQAGAKKIKNIFVVKESEKSKKPNAFFTGIGNTQSIALFDTLLDNFTSNEVETVISHELGHYIHRDILKGIIIEAVKMFFTFFIISYILQIYIVQTGIASISNIATLPFIMLVMLVNDIILMPALNTYSRKQETRADDFALNISKKPTAQISAEKRLADMALAETEPHPLIEFIFHSHPSTKKRIESCKNWKKRK